MTKEELTKHKQQLLAKACDSVEFQVMPHLNGEVHGRLNRLCPYFMAEYEQPCGTWCALFLASRSEVCEPKTVRVTLGCSPARTTLTIPVTFKPEE